MICKSQLRNLARILLIVAVFVFAGCGRRRTAGPAPVETTVENMRVADARPDQSPPALRREVVILFNDAPGYAEVAAQLHRLLPAETYRTTLTNVAAESSRKVLTSLKGRIDLFAVAIGLPAARIARDQLSAPIVFAQVFNYQELLVSGRAIRGVTAMPPLDLQIQDWKKLDPDLRRIGLIVSKAHSGLIPQAERAAMTAGLTIKHEISESDRETLYLFKRLAPQIDGFWLIPDDRILSPAVLRELLSYAVSHGVRVCAFSDALLPWGALMSASPAPEDIARTLRRVLDGMLAGTNGQPSAQPALSPLSQVVVRINTDVAGRLGLPAPLRSSWVVRGLQ